MNTVISENPRTSLPVDPEIEEMMKSGVHLGHVRSKRNPGMLSYLWGVRNNVDIIDLAVTREKLQEALAFLRRMAKERKVFLLVGTRPSSKDLVRAVADELKLPYVNQRWIGGTLTNFKVIRARIEHLETMEQDKASGGFEKYTKKERMKKDEEMAKLKNNFEGLRPMDKLPDVVVIADIAHDDLALREAKRLTIPVLALIDTNTDPRSVEHPIPANNDAKTAVAYILGRIKAAIEDGWREAEEAAASKIAADVSPKESS